MCNGKEADNTFKDSSVIGAIIIQPRPHFTSFKKGFHGLVVHAYLPVLVENM